MNYESLEHKKKLKWLERNEWYLWTLSFLVLGIYALCIVIIAQPESWQDAFKGVLRSTFLILLAGLLILTILLCIYIIHREKVIKKLRRELIAEVQLQDMSQLLKQYQESQEELKNTSLQMIQNEKLKALGELTAGVAHELNQPLNTIKIICQSLQRDMVKGNIDLKSLPQDLKDIADLINRMAEIIDHMRVFTRRTENSSLEVFSVNQPIEGVFKLLGQQLAVHNIKVVQQLHPNLPSVKANSGRIEQVLINLIGNARSAVEEFRENDRMIEIKTYLRESPANKTKMVVTEVKDNGGGIPDEIQKRIFEPFFTTKRPGKGTGLGLSVSKKILEEYQGTIEVESIQGEGSTFRVILPAVEDGIKTN
jgi:C4-dicarboxylate-specific signal transduction histidine kinase